MNIAFSDESKDESFSFYLTLSEEGKKGKVTLSIKSSDLLTDKINLLLCHLRIHGKG